MGCSWLWVTTNFFMCLRRQLGYWLAVCRLLSISTNRNQQFFCCVRHKGDQETRFFKFIGLKAHDTKLVASENSAVIRFICGKAFQWALWKGHLSKMWPRYSYRKVVFLKKKMFIGCLSLLFFKYVCQVCTCDVTLCWCLHPEDNSSIYEWCMRNG